MRNMTSLAAALVLTTSTGAHARGISGAGLGTTGHGATCQGVTPQQGWCMFDDEFDGPTLNTTVWEPLQSAIGPSTAQATFEGCFTPSNVSIQNGVLVMSVTENTRQLCPSDWSWDTFKYPTYITPVPTLYDAAAVQMRTFSFLYGVIDMRVVMPGGNNMWPTIWLAGWQCQYPSTVAAVMTGPMYVGGSGPCNWPYPQSSEGDIYEISGTHVGDNILDFTHYTDEASGAPFLGTLPNSFEPGGINYYGATIFEPSFIDPGVISDPSLNWHTIRVVWEPGIWQLWIDGTLQANLQESWILNYPLYLNMYSEVVYPPSGFPQSMQVDYVRIWCPVGVQCSVNHQ